jgi:hypothetical protein
MDGNGEHPFISKVTQAQKAKTYSDYRPKTNAIILSDVGHTLRGKHAWEK